MIDPTIVSNAVLGLTAWGGAFIITFWLSLIFWAYRDIRKRTGDRLMQMLAVIIVTILFLPGVLVYLILRPQQTLEEEYQKSLEEEALLNAIESTAHCPGCSRRVDSKWMVCPDCHTRLMKTCHHCSKLMELQWNICPHCATPVPGMKKEGLSMDEALRPTPLEPEPERDS
ncbi:MAG TPA: zinc ribbon domain-containing protein [Chloroflexi bacterium]|nr:zinc ribbon domain-containing protein [Chloroflexota bacterium]